MHKDVWVLGATGRSGRAIVERLAARGVASVLVGRDAGRLGAAAAPRGLRTVVTASTAEMAAAIRRERPGVVVNTVGPFVRTAQQLAEATLETGDYLDLANDIATFRTLRGLEESARHSGHTIVTGAGFGVTATESVLTRLMEGQPAPARVRVDMIPSMAMSAGRVGEALAASLTEGLPGVPGGGRFQGRLVVDGQLAPAAIGGSPLALVTPDGDTVTSGLMPLGELLAAQHASGAPYVEAASSEAPSGAARVLLGAALPLLHLEALRRVATRRLGAIRTAARPAPRRHSWGRARVELTDGTVREGWLEVGTAGEFTAAVATEVAVRLAGGGGRPGSYTPAALFGSELAEACGGRYLLDRSAPSPS